MKFFDAIFKKKKEAEITANTPVSKSKEAQSLKELEGFLQKLQESDHYIARSEYYEQIREYAETVSFMRKMDEADMLVDFCSKNGLSSENVRELCTNYENIVSFVDNINENYLSRKKNEEKEYLDNILKDIDPDICLDENQREVILSDEDYGLVVAGAGAGKTTTVAAKVKYLVEKQHIDPSQILMISFTNKAVNELRERINRDLNIPCPIATFHSAGNAILHKNDPQNFNIVDSNKLFFCIQRYLKDKILREPVMVKKLVLFFASYFDAPYEGDDINDFFNHMAHANYATMRSELEDFRTEVIDRKTRNKVTIQNEVVRSYQEVEIANFFYLNNIDYEYEPVYKYNIMLSRKPYTPDFIIRQNGQEIYVEHFGITEDGQNSLYTEEQLNMYKKAVNDKILFHKKHGTTLIYTFSSYKDGRSISAHLEEKLRQHGIELKRRSDEEVAKKLVSSEENRYIKRLIILVSNFIRNFKVNGYDEDDFAVLNQKTDNVRTKLFLEISQACYLEYKKWLIENHAVDFEDMINESARVLNNVKEMKQKLDFKYLIVDEYQDISRQRFDLVKAFSEVTSAKVVAVGDDWQSIYAFSGSDITLFTKFEEKMGYARLMKIVHTYRNSQEVIDIAGNFIQKNTSQIRKSLISPKHIENPVIIYTYDSTMKSPNAHRRSGADYAMAYAVQTSLEQIIKYAKQDGKDPYSLKILLLGRFGFDGQRLTRTGMYEYVNRGSKVKSVKYPQMNITFMTAHASKGLGYDEVIVINGRNETYGFPSKIEDDPVLSLVVKEDRSMQYAEERRLFYVAMTRTKNRVYFIAPEQNPSEFLLEIKNEYKNVSLCGTWSEEPVILERKKCPVCGFPMQLRYKPAYGLRLYICTNEPEECSFMTNHIMGKKLGIMKCPDCQDGYLIVKFSENRQYFLGCTNYQNNGKGCNKTLSAKEYYKLMGYDLTELDWLPKKEIKEENTKPQQKTIEYVSHNGQHKNDNWEQKILDKNADSENSRKKYPEYKGHSLFEIVETIMNALVHISEKKYFGVSILSGVLRGSNAEKIKKNGLDKVKEYSALSYLSGEEVTRLIYWLIGRHYIIKTTGQYPVLHITSEGLKYAELFTPRIAGNLLKWLETEVDRRLLDEQDI